MNRLKLLGVVNAAAIGAICLVGWLTEEWYVRAVGGSPGTLEMARWLLIALNAPAFLVSVATLSFFHLDLLSEFVAEHILWAALSLLIWPAYARLQMPSDRITRAILVVMGFVAAVGAAWVFAIAWRQGHDPHHSCWDALQAVFMLVGLAATAFMFASVRRGVPKPAA